jgi:multidrug efflux system outer membrane protein
MKVKNHQQPPLLFLILFFLSCCLFSGGCSEVGPDYQREQLKTDEHFAEATPSQLDPEKVIQVDWWKGFNDSVLNSLIKKAIDESFDLKILVARVLAAGALIDQNEAALYPSLDSNTSAIFSNTKASGSSKSFTVGLDLNWELDIWGKNRRRVKAARAEQQAVKADYRAGYLTLVSDVALAYFSIRQYDVISALTVEFIKQNEEILKIYELQAREGIVSQENVFRQRALVNEYRQELLELKRGRDIQEHKLAALLGQPTGAIQLTKTASQPLHSLPLVPVGLPSDLLNRRPDILAAEYRLNSATQAIGVAEAARLPSISLTAKGGLTSMALSSLLSGGFLSFLPVINLPIFDGGQRKAEVEKARYEMEEEKNKWAKTANTAFQEVADSLTNLANHRQQLDVANKRVADMKMVQGQLKQKLELGLVSQLELIDIQLNLYTSRMAQEQLRTLLFVDTVSLYKALGGGWPEDFKETKMQ